MNNRLLVHGVPNTPEIWSELLGEIGEDLMRPCLPGFCTPRSEGFRSTKDEYANWLVRIIEDRHAQFGPIDIFGHDWGAILTLRAVSLRPKLIKSWAISGATIDSDYHGHLIAKIWNTPLLGEFAMAVSAKKTMEAMFRLNGIPSDIARHEALAWSSEMRHSILELYRSSNGLEFDGDWVERLEQLPGRGLMIWGAKDPYVPVSAARRFAAKHGIKLHVELGAGHWVTVQRPGAVAQLLQAHWGE